MWRALGEASSAHTTAGASGSRPSKQLSAMFSRAPGSQISSSAFPDLAACNILPQAPVRICADLLHLLLYCKTPAAPQAGDGYVLNESSILEDQLSEDGLRLSSQDQIPVQLHIVPLSAADLVNENCTDDARQLPCWFLRYSSLAVA